MSGAAAPDVADAAVVAVAGAGVVSGAVAPDVADAAVVAVACAGVVSGTAAKGAAVASDAALFLFFRSFVHRRCRMLSSELEEEESCFGGKKRTREDSSKSTGQGVAVPGSEFGRAGRGSVVTGAVQGPDDVRWVVVAAKRDQGSSADTRQKPHKMSPIPARARTSRMAAGGMGSPGEPRTAERAARDVGKGDARGPPPRRRSSS